MSTEQSTSVTAATTADNEIEESDGYKPAAKVDLATIVSKDADDEALARYKASLLGSAADPSKAAADAETRHVVIREIRVLVDGRPDLVMKLSTPEEVKEVEGSKLVVKEGATYRLQFVFTVHRDVVLGLKFSNTVYKLGIPVDKDSVVVGAYAPRPEPYEFTLPPAEWPSGMLARGNYSAKTRFTDDDQATHLSLNWSFQIQKTWPDGS